MKPEINLDDLEKTQESGQPPKKPNKKISAVSLGVAILACGLLMVGVYFLVRSIPNDYKWEQYVLPFINHSQLDLSASTVSASQDSYLENNEPNYILIGNLVGGYVPENMYIQTLVDDKELKLEGFSGRSFSDEISIDNGWHDIQVRLIARWLGQKMTLDTKEFGIHQTGKTSTPPIIVGLDENDGIYHVAGYMQPKTDIFWDTNAIKVIKPPDGSHFSPYSENADGQIIRIGAGQDGRFEIWFSLVRDSNKQIMLSTVEDNPLSGQSVILDLENPADFTDDLLAMKKTANIDFQVTVHPGFINKTIVLKVDPDNQNLANLMEGQITGNQFIESLVGPIVENGHQWGISDTIKPEIIINSGEATVTYNDNSSMVGQINMLGESDVRYSFPFGFPLLGNTGTFSVKINDLDVFNSFPVPSGLDEGLYSWDKIIRQQDVTFNLFRSPKNFLLGLSSFSLFDIYHNPDWLLETLQWISGLILATPILWLIAILLQSFRSGQTKKQDFLWIGSVLSGSLFLLLLSRTWYLMTVFSQSLGNSSWFRNFLSGLPPVFFPDIQFNDSDRFLLAALIVMLFLVAFISYNAYDKHRFGQSIFLKTASNIIEAFLFIVLINFAVQIIYTLLKQYFQDLDVSIFGWIVFSLTAYFLLSRLWQRLKSFHFTEPLQAWESYIRFLLFFLAFIITIPLKTSNAIQYLISTNRVDYPLVYLLSTFSAGALYFGFLGIVALLNIYPYSSEKEKQIPTNDPKILRMDGFLGGYQSQERSSLIIAQLIFAGFIIGTGDQWLFFPVSFLIAIWLFKYMIRPASEMAMLFFNAAYIRNQRGSLIENITKFMAADRLETRLDDLLSDLSEGKILPSEYEKSAAEIRAEKEKIQSNSPLAQGVNAEDDAFAISPFENRQKNVGFAVRWGLVLTIPLVLLFMSINLDRLLNQNAQFFWLTFVVQLGVFIIRWIIVSYFYGAYYDYLRGTNGLKKALFLTGFIAAATLPYQLFTMNGATGLSTFILEIGQIAYFLIGLGLIFTWKILRANGYSYRYLRLVIADIPSLVSAGSLVVGVAGTIVTTMITGQLNQVLSAVMNVVLPTFVHP